MLNWCLNLRVLVWLSIILRFLNHLQSSNAETFDDPLEEKGIFPEELICDNIYDWVSPTDEVPGYHVLCLQIQGNDEQEGMVAEGFRNGFQESVTTFFSIKPDFDDFRKTVERELQIENIDANQHNTQKQAWRAFNTDGKVLSTIKDITHSRIVLIFEGGQWVWPGVQTGFTRTLQNVADLEDITITTLSMRPLVVEIKNFLTFDECDHIIEVSKNHMSESVVALMDHDKGKPSTDWRTSQTHWLYSYTEELQQIDIRIANVTRVQKAHQEPVQVLKYDKNGKYDAHHDYFDPQFYKDTRMIDGGHKNRLLTVFWYLNSVESGGQTGFARAGKGPHPTTFVGCDDYPLLSSAVKGKVIIFYNLLASGELDPYSLHAGCPVEKGVKWSANKWVWNKPRS